MSASKEAAKKGSAKADPVVYAEPTPQAIVAWKGKADKLVESEKELAASLAELEAKLDPIRKEHEPEIERLRKRVSELRNEVVEFGTEHRELLFAEESKVRTKVSIIQGAATPPSVQLEEGFEEREVIEALRSDRSLKKYLAVKESIDKAAVKKALTSAGDAIRETLGLAGLVLASGFRVTVKPKGE
jgi:phage host-nuclease inhibitor protein Gam